MGSLEPKGGGIEGIEEDQKVDRDELSPGAAKIVPPEIKVYCPVLFHGQKTPYLYILAFHGWSKMESTTEPRTGVWDFCDSQVDALPTCSPDVLFLGFIKDQRSSVTLAGDLRNGIDAAAAQGTPEVLT